MSRTQNIGEVRKQNIHLLSQNQNYHRTSGPLVSPNKIPVRYQYDQSQNKNTSNTPPLFGTRPSFTNIERVRSYN